jgi:hypothetical protein
VGATGQAASAWRSLEGTDRVHVNDIRKLQLRNKANQDRELQARIQQFQRRGELIPAELQAVADAAARGKWRMFSLLLAAGVSVWVLYELMGPRR